jgi:crotonobetainyl-CoA:carnitine CoA-transferase CaiB-like acyl-CoA transferase
MNARPLRGVRILDLSRLLPGPFCTLLLADLGAEVIKIEDLEGGDYIRAWPPFIDGQGAYFLALNPGQKSVALNLKAPAGRALFLKLAATTVWASATRPSARSIPASSTARSPASARTAPTGTGPATI